MAKHPLAPGGDAWKLYVLLALQKASWTRTDDERRAIALALKTDALRGAAELYNRALSMGARS